MKKAVIVTVLLHLLAAVPIGMSGCATAIFTPSEYDNPAAADSVTAVVTRVVDGDTIETDTGEKIRLIGIDTPESVSPDESKNVPFGKKATEYTESLVLNRKVRIEFDVQRADKYERLLGYVYLDPGDAFINYDLVRNGYARAMAVEPNVRYEELLKGGEELAKSEELGIWGDVPAAFPK